MNNNHNNKPSGNRSGRRPLTREEAILAERRRAEKRQRQKETKLLIDKAVAVIFGIGCSYFTAGGRIGGTVVF